MDHFQYLILLALCLIGTAPLELAIGARVYRQPQRLATSIIPVAFLFCLFDAASIHWQWWHYSTKFVSGIFLPGQLPLEEVLFFLVIPICGILTLEAVKTLTSKPSSTDNI